MKTIIARFAILLGVLGIVLLSVAAIAAWYGAFAVVDQTKHVTERASERLSKVEARLVRLEEKVSNVTVDVKRIRDAAAEIVQQTVSNVLARTEFQQLLDRLDRLLEQAESHGETLSIVSRLFEDTADLRSQLGQNQERVQRLQAIAETLDRVVASLLNLRGELTALRERQGEPDPRKLTDLAGGTLERLENLIAGIDGIRQYSVDAREDLDHLRGEVRFWSITASIILTSVFIWLGLGQLCLVGWGRRRLRPATPTEASTG